MEFCTDTYWVPMNFRTEWSNLGNSLLKLLNLIKIFKTKAHVALRQNLTWARKLDYHYTFNSSAFFKKKKISSTAYLVYSRKWNECESA